MNSESSGGCRNSRFWENTQKIMTRMVEILQKITSQNRLGAVAATRDSAGEKQKNSANGEKNWRKYGKK